MLLEGRVFIRADYRKKEEVKIKGTVSPDYTSKCLEVISIKSPLLGYVTLDINIILNSPINF